MFKVNELLEAIKNMEAAATEVCLCNEETEKHIKDNIELPPNIVFICNNIIEKNTIYVVKDIEFKKTLLEGYFIGKEKIERVRNE